MNRRYTVPVLLLCAVAAGAGETVELPQWLRSKIADYEKLAVSSPPRTVFRTEHEGRTVYYVPPACCDIPSELYAQDGTLLCYPDGGFAGGDGRCPTFNVLTRVPAVVWRDSRTGVRK